MMVAALLCCLAAVSSSLVPATNARAPPITMKGSSPMERPDLIRTDLPPEKRKQVAKARRAVKQEGKGGFGVRKGAKRTEQKKPSAGNGFGVMQSPLNYDRRPALTAQCACDKDATYGECCAPLHDGGDAATPDDLVRARYTAFTYRLPDYLMRTTDPEGNEFEADTAGWTRSLLKFADEFEFQKLEVGEVVEGAGSVGKKEQAGGAQEEAHLAKVDFKANFCQKGTVNLMVLGESSTFRKVDGKWLYSQGDVSYERQ